ncbi:MAG: hypothetical protein ACPL25_05080 [Ignavibacteria bacterium]
MKRKIFLINILFTLVLFELVTSIILKKYNLITLSRYGVIEQDVFKTKSVCTNFNYPEKYNQNFIDLSKDKIEYNQTFERTIEAAIKIREQFLNLASKSDTSVLISRYPDKLFIHMRLNKTLLCGEIARLYGYILHLLGFNVRYITISRSIFDSFDRHSTIEIWDEKRQKWIISDPTFNVSFMKDTTFLSSDELYDLIHSGNFASIKVIHGKPTLYETKLENYYISIYSLFDNVYFIKTIQHFTLNEIPPIRWIDENFKVYLLKSNKFPVYGNGIKIQNSIVFFVLFLFPIIILILSIYLSFLILDEKISSKKLMMQQKPVLVKFFRTFYK